MLVVFTCLYEHVTNLFRSTHLTQHRDCTVENGKMVTLDCRCLNHSPKLTCLRTYWMFGINGTNTLRSHSDSYGSFGTNIWLIYSFSKDQKKEFFNVLQDSNHLLLVGWNGAQGQRYKHGSLVRAAVATTNSLSFSSDMLVCNGYFLCGHSWNQRKENVFDWWTRVFNSKI